MKKIGIISILGALFIFISCSKDEGFGPQNFHPQDMGHGPSISCPAIMVPAPNGTDDTENILEAMSLAKAQGPGSVVKLQEGSYMLNIIKVYDFIGTLKGAGKEKTFLKPVPGLLCLEETSTVGCVSLISFIGGDITISDISFTVDDGDPCAADYLTYAKDLYVLVKFTDMLHEDGIPEEHSVNATVKNCNFSCGTNSPDGAGLKYNTSVFIWFGHDFLWTGSGERAVGDLDVQNCNFTGAMCALDLAGMGEGKIIVNNNKFMDLYAPLFYYDNINITGFIGRNRFINSGWYDVYIDDTNLGVYGYYTDEAPVKRSLFKIWGNIFNTYNYGGSYIQPCGVGIYMLDMRTASRPEENMPMRFIVESNFINLNDNASGIVGLNNRDAMIIANKFTGEGSTGISLNGSSAGLMSSKNKVLGNNFMKSDIETDVFLGEFTTNCLVTMNHHDVVVDLGVDNKIAGPSK
ncbi:MAG: hypothetical protein JXR66_05615 [Bacteroidales bacterium]|nr:hypothetical protein [Bacteroidales bacterium]